MLITLSMILLETYGNPKMKQTPDIIQSKNPNLTARKKVKNSMGKDINPTVAVASTAVYWLFKFKTFIFLLLQINGAKMNLKSFQ